MPVYKNEDNGTWYVVTRYLDWKGERKQKCKRGFETKREAQEWERVFQQQSAAGKLLIVFPIGEKQRAGYSLRVLLQLVGKSRRKAEILPPVGDKTASVIAIRYYHKLGVFFAVYHGGGLYDNAVFPLYRVSVNIKHHLYRGIMGEIILYRAVAVGVRTVVGGIIVL